MITYILQGISLGLSAAASPGPFQAFLIGRTLKNGWKQTLPAVLAPLISDGPIILLMVLVISSLPPPILRLIQIGGGVFVLYLAWKAFQAFRHFQPAEQIHETGRTLWQAILTNFLSPGPYIYWSLVTGPLLVRGWKEGPSHGLVFLLGFYTAMISALVLIVVIFGAARQLGPRVSRILIGLSSIALFGFGVYQLFQGLS